MSLHIYLFGPFELLRDGKPVAGPGWRSRQTRTILKVLLSRRGSVVSADQFLELLWPDEDPESARRHLHVRISQLRKALAANRRQDEGYLLTVGSGYTFDCGDDCWLDVAAFSQQVERGRRAHESQDLVEAVTAYETARTLYRGDFLEEDLYESWTFGERERLRELKLMVLTELAECYAQQGRYRRAIGLCEEIVLADPVREAVYLHLMLYHYYAGEQAQALRNYDRCRDVLLAELGVDPLPGTRQLAAQIRAGTLWSEQSARRYPPPAYEGRLFAVPYSLGNPPFTGREREYAWLVERWQDPSVSVLLLAGEAGIGKSRLAREFLGYAALRGATVMETVVAPGESRPYAALATALRSYPGLWPGVEEVLSSPALRALRYLFPELASSVKLPPQRDGDRFLWQDPSTHIRLRRALLQLARSQLPPDSIFFIDNAHHLDSASAEMFAQLGKYYTILLSYRGEETRVDHPLLQAMHPLRRAGHASSLELAPLSPADSERLLRQLAGPTLPATVAEAGKRAAGVPLFLVATLQHLFEEGALYVSSGGAWAAIDDNPRALPPTIRETIERRLRRLQGEQQRIFDVAAVAGSQLDFELLRQVSGLEDSQILEAVDALLEVGLLQEPRTRGQAELTFSHDRYREVAYQRLPRLRRRHLHGRVAGALHARYRNEPEAAATLAHHYRQARLWSEAVHHARRAGEHALLLYAGEEAVTHFARCLSWAEAGDLPLTEAEQALIHFYWGEALRRRGVYEEALSHLEEAWRRGAGEIKLISAFRLASVAAIRGEGLGAFRRLRDGLEAEVSGIEESAALALLRWEQGYTAALRGEAPVARNYHALGWRVARRLRTRGEAPPAWARARAYCGLGRSHELWGEGRRALRCARRALALYEQEGDGNGIGAALYVLGTAHFGLGEWQQALETFHRQLALAEEAQDPRTAGDARYYLGLIAFLRGEYAVAATHADRIVETADGTGDILRLTLGHSLRARLLQIEGAIADAVAIHRRHEQLASAMEARFLAVRAIVLLAEAQLAQGGVELALATAERGLAIGRTACARWELIPLLRVQGVALATREARDAARIALDEAITLGMRSGCLYELASAHVARGDLYRQDGCIDEARMQWQAGRLIFSALGARPMLSQTGDRLRQSGFKKVE